MNHKPPLTAAELQAEEASRMGIPHKPKATSKPPAFKLANVFYALLLILALLVCAGFGFWAYVNNHIQTLIICAVVGVIIGLLWRIARALENGKG